MQLLLKEILTWNIEETFGGIHPYFDLLYLSPQLTIFAKGFRLGFGGFEDLKEALVRRV